MRVALLIALSAAACGGRTLANDPSFDDAPPMGGTGGGGFAGTLSVAGMPSSGGTPGKGGMFPMPGKAGSNAGGVPGKGGSPGVAGWGAGGSLAGGAFPGGFAGAPSGGTGGGPALADCKAFCSQLGRLCDPQTSIGACLENCRATIFPGAPCVNENLRLMRCATRALSEQAPDICIELTEVLLSSCLEEFVALERCNGMTVIPTCSERRSASPDGCTVDTVCDNGDFALLRCVPSGTFTRCTCITQRGEDFTTDTPYPVEKACYEPTIDAACRPQAF